MSWYVAVAKNGRTMRAVDELVERGFVVICPLERYHHRDIRNRKQTIERPAMMRYVLVLADGDDDLYAIRRTADVDHVLSNDVGPITVPDGEVDTILELDASGLLDRTSRAYRDLEPGLLVRLAKGLFEGVMGKLMKYRGHGKWQVELSNAYGHGAGKMVASEDEVEVLDGATKAA